jgi:predicted HNH restriction endonuclease
VALVKHLKRERNVKLIKIAKDKFIEKNGHLFCEACGFDFKKEYGDLGKDFIEAHHTKPISEMKDNEKTRIEDIEMLCSNCHSMIHRKKPWLKKGELKKLLNKRKA